MFLNFKNGQYNFKPLKSAVFYNGSVLRGEKNSLNNIFFAQSASRSWLIKFGA